MPKLFTNSPSALKLSPSSSSSYAEYEVQRTADATVTKEKISDLVTRFKTVVADPFNEKNTGLAMGNYFVIPVAELREMISESGDAPEFIHVCNGLKDATDATGAVKTFPIVILMPVKKTVEKEDAYTIPENEASVYIEAYPCPPAKGCPTTRGTNTTGII